MELVWEKLGSAIYTLLDSNNQYRYDDLVDVIIRTRIDIVQLLQEQSLYRNDSFATNMFIKQAVAQFISNSKKSQQFKKWFGAVLEMDDNTKVVRMKRTPMLSDSSAMIESISSSDEKLKSCRHTCPCEHRGVRFTISDLKEHESSSEYHKSPSSSCDVCILYKLQPPVDQMKGFEEDFVPAFLDFVRDELYRGPSRLNGVIQVMLLQYREKIAKYLSMVSEGDILTRTITLMNRYLNNIENFEEMTLNLKRSCSMKISKRGSEWWVHPYNHSFEPPNMEYEEEKKDITQLINTEFLPVFIKFLGSHLTKDKQLSHLVTECVTEQSSNLPNLVSHIGFTRKEHTELSRSIFNNLVKKWSNASNLERFNEKLPMNLEVWQADDGTWMVLFKDQTGRENEVEESSTTTRKRKAVEGINELKRKTKEKLSALETMATSDSIDANGLRALISNLELIQTQCDVLSQKKH